MTYCVVSKSVCIILTCDVPFHLQNRLAQAIGVQREDVNIPSSKDTCAVVAFVPIWRKPWMTINGMSYGASLLRSIGIDVSHASSKDPYPVLSMSQFPISNASVALLPSEPYTFGEKHISEIRELCGIDDVRLIDGKDLFWWGHRTPSARRKLKSQLSDLVSS